MAQQQTSQQDPSEVQGGRYAERRAPQFIGGQVEQSTGNIIPETRQSVSAAARPTTRLGQAEPQETSSNSGPSATSAAASNPAPLSFQALNAPTAQAAPAPAAPATASASSTTRLGYVEPTPAPAQAPAAEAPSLGQTLIPAAIGAAAPVVGGTFGASVGSTLGSGGGVGEALGNAASNIGSNLIGSVTGGGPAAASGGSLGTSIGSTAGGAIGAGLGTLAAGLIQGGRINDPNVYEPAIGSAIGFAVGNFILPGIGGFVGSFLGGLFCHAAGTPILMADGSRKNVEDIDIYDHVLFGGRVLGCAKVLAQELYHYKGTVVTGRHAVFEDGRWLRVAESPIAERYDGVELLVYPLITEHHVFACPHYVCADYIEVDCSEMGTDAQRLAALNAATVRNEALVRAAELIKQL